MANTVSDFFWKRLSDWGVRRVFGYPGDGINGLIGALARAQDRLEFVQARHEELAAFMACGHAKFTGELGVCLATSGPGAIHLLNGLYDAKTDHQPVLAIVGQTDRLAMGGHYQQEVDLLSLFKDVAGDYVHMATAPGQVRQLIDRAVRIAKAERTVTCIIMPKDIQELDAVESPPRKHGAIFTGIGYDAPEILPTQASLERAARVLNEGKKVAILVGAGALKATDEVIEIADKLGAGVAKALLGKAALPDDLPFVTGSIGLLGTGPSYDMMVDCDTLLMIGSRFPYSEFLPKEGQARGVQIDIDPKMVSIRYPMEVNLIGDSAATLRKLMPLLEHKKDRSWRQQIEKNVKEWWQTLESRAMVGANPLNPQRVFWELSPRLPENCIIACDTGSGDQLVCPRSEDPPRHDGVRVGFVGDDGAGNAVRDCRQVRLSRAAGAGAGRRRRAADERDERADHAREILEAVARPEVHRAGPQQPGSEPGHLGDAGDERRSEIRRVAAAARCPLLPICRAARAEGHLCR